MASTKTRHGKHGNTYYVHFRHQGTQTSRPFDDERAANLFRDEINATAPYPGGRTDATKALERLEGVKVNRKGGPTVAEWVERNIARGLARTREPTRPKTAVKYRQILANDIVPAFGEDMRLRRLTFCDIDAWIKKMIVEGTSPKTIHNKWAVLGSAINYGMQTGELQAHPCAEEDEFLPVIVKGFKGRILKEHEFERICQGMPHGYGRTDQDMRLFLKFLITSGLRFSEAVALEPVDVDMVLGKAFIHQVWEWLPVDARTIENPGPYELKDVTKTPTSTRHVHVPHEMLEALKDAGMLDPARAFVFLNADGGPIRQYTFKNMWDLALQRAKIPGKRPTIKDLRATFASGEIKGGTDELVVQKAMGHANVATTLTWYAQMDDNAARAAADKRGKRWFK